MDHFDFDGAKVMLKKMLTPFRYNHSIGTMDMCAQLAKKYSYNVEWAKIAGLLHDCAKDIESAKIIDLCIKIGVQLDEYHHSNPVLAHGILGAEIVKKLYKNSNALNEDIVLAIAEHATGKPNMSLLSKILFISDFSEVGRQGESAAFIRNAVQDSLDKGLLAAFDHYIGSLIKSGSVIHPLTVSARNFILLNQL